MDVLRCGGGWWWWWWWWWWWFSRLGVQLIGWPRSGAHNRTRIGDGHYQSSGCVHGYNFYLKNPVNPILLPYTRTDRRRLPFSQIQTILILHNFLTITQVNGGDTTNNPAPISPRITWQRHHNKEAGNTGV
ncbi:hypothetical protein K440DRAFT_260343 [Wilcoxina mikolae CBS 423.85]|nr:hypothetical protein K440DRAFT_260343 [Wilcoxina mikolae CBS 423.85]